MTYYLTYRKTGTPICRDGDKTISITDKREEEEEELINFIKTLDFDKIFDEMELKKMTLREREKTKAQLTMHLKKGIEPVDPELKKIYDFIMAQIKSGKIKRTQILTNNTLEVIPIDKIQKRACFRIVGQSGSGKSYFVKNIMKQYRELYPERDIFIFSQLASDSTIDSLNFENVYRIKLNDKFLEAPINLSDLEKSLCIFDDWNTSSSKKINDKVQLLLNKILQEGRHLDISVCEIDHLLTNYSKSRISLLESNFLVFFVKTTSAKNLKYLLMNYSSLSPEKIAQILKIKSSRWICLHKTDPVYIVTENSVEIIE